MMKSRQVTVVFSCEHPSNEAGFVLDALRATTFTINPQRLGLLAKRPYSFPGLAKTLLFSGFKSGGSIWYRSFNEAGKELAWGQVYNFENGAFPTGKKFHVTLAVINRNLTFIVKAAGQNLGVKTQNSRYRFKMKHTETWVNYSGEGVIKRFVRGQQKHVFINYERLDLKHYDRSLLRKLMTPPTNHDETTSGAIEAFKHPATKDAFLCALEELKAREDLVVNINHKTSTGAVTFDMYWVPEAARARRKTGTTTPIPDEEYSAECLLPF